MDELNCDIILQLPIGTKNNKYQRLDNLMQPGFLEIPLIVGIILNSTYYFFYKFT